MNTPIPTEEFERARQWRFRRGLTMRELSEQIGYSEPAISWFERGLVPPLEAGRKPKPVNPKAWLRYRLLCELVERRLRSPNTKPFEW